jgi:hypothetical protein
MLPLLDTSASTQPTPPCTNIQPHKWTQIQTPIPTLLKSHLALLVLFPIFPPIESIWEFINDPIEEKITAQIAAQIEKQQRGESSQHQRLSRRYIVRDHEAGQNRLIRDYFSTNPVYTDEQLRRRYRMRRHLFLQIVQALGDWSPYFQQRSDANGKLGFSPLHKCIVAMRMLAYGTCADI